MYLRNILQKIGISIILLFIISYGVYKLYPLISGPKIDIISSEIDTNSGGGLIKIKGYVYKAKKIKIFDREISVDTNGYFEENIIKQDVFTNVIVTAKDKYGRVVTNKFFVQ